MSDRCKSCHAPIEWVKTPKKRRMPLDPMMQAMRLSPKGKTVLVDESGNAFRGDLVPPEEAETDQTIFFGRTSHFATCPQAAQHRRRAE
jgi:hypothetical protein